MRTQSHGVTALTYNSGSPDLKSADIHDFLVDDRPFEFGVWGDTEGATAPAEQPTSISVAKIITA